MNIGIVIVAGLMLVFATWQTALLWSGSNRFPFRESAPVGFPMSDSLWKHYVRATPVVVFGGGIGLLIGYVIAEVANGIGTAVLGLVVLVSVFVLAPSIVLFNQPKVLVPPGLRSEPGWIEERRRAGEGRTT